MAVIIIRTLIIYIGLMLSMRIMGKRQLGELEISELVVAVLVADVTAMPLQDIGIPLINGIIPLIMLLCCEILVTGAATKNIRLRQILFGKPSVLIRNGRIIQQEMKRNRFTIDELYEELRQQGITDVTKVERAVLETSGILNVILYPSDQPLTPNLMGIPCPPKGIPHILISEGHIMSETLKRIGKNEKWLMKQLKSHSITSPKDVYLYTIDDSETEYIAKLEINP